LKLFYLANQIYQLSYTKSIYQNLGGSFIVPNFKKLLKFKWGLRNGLYPTFNQAIDYKTIIIKKNIKQLSDFEGLIISQSNIKIKSDNKKFTSIFIGHGTGDKKYGGNPKILNSYDYHFISGEKHLFKLKDVGINIPKDRQVLVGNPRFDDYINNYSGNKSYLKFLGVKDVNKSTVLYAPTWKWGGGTLRTLVYKLARAISTDYNLIVRPHHFDIHLIPWLKTWSKLQGIKNIYFSNPNNILHEDTMEVFASSDILISDTSSMIYEYLITQKPIIRIKTTEKKDLHLMPDEMTIIGKSDTIFPDEIKNINSIINKNLKENPYQNLYKDLLDKCFYFNDGKSTERAINFILKLFKHKK
jgi:CDP-glycerol glycerophosphotransferase (TagB/SpsB family)